MLGFKKTIWLGAHALFLLAGSVASAQEYTVVDLGTLGGNSSVANSISPDGVIAGWAQLPSSVKHAVIWNAGGIVDLGAPSGFVVSEAAAVNDMGEVAGFGEGNPQSYESYFQANGSWTSVGSLDGLSDSIVTDIDATGRIVGWSLIVGPGAPDRAFLWDDGVLTDLGTLGGRSQAHAINAIGQIVGGTDADLPEGGTADRAFLWQNGVMTSLGKLPDRDHSQAFGINDLGDVVGSSWIITSPQFFAADRATLWRDAGEEIIDLGLTPGPAVCVSGYPFYTDNVARAINNCGQVVGEAQCVGSGGAKAAFLWQDGTMHNLNDLIPMGSGWELLSAQDINDRGQIVGFGLKASNGSSLRAYRLDPIDPQPCHPGDIDNDGDVDEMDLSLFTTCLNGPDVNIPPMGCSKDDFNRADLEVDDDVDLDDYAAFQAIFAQ